MIRVTHALIVGFILLALVSLTIVLLRKDR